MSNQRSRRPISKGAPAAALLGGAPPPTKIIEDESATTAVPTPPSSQEATARDMTAEEDHKSKQEAYRRQMEEFTAELEAQTSPDIPEVAEPDEPTAEELEEARQLEEEQRQAEWLDSYAQALQADEGNPQYVVGRRPPRPKWQGVQLNLGDVVPGAYNWPRLDSWVRTGIVEPRARTG